MGQAEARIHDEEVLKQEIIKELDLVDSKMLRIVHSMMRAYAVERQLEEDPIIDYEADGTPVRSSEFLKEARGLVEEVRNGEFVTMEKLKEEKEAWLKSIE